METPEFQVALLRDHDGSSDSWEARIEGGDLGMNAYGNNQLEAVMFLARSLGVMLWHSWRRDEQQTAKWEPVEKLLREFQSSKKKEEERDEPISPA